MIVKKRSRLPESIPATLQITRPLSLFLLNAGDYPKIYGPDELDEIGRLSEIYAPLQTRESVDQDPSVLAKAECLFSSWGMAKMDAAFLDAAPNLRAVFYGAGSIRGIVTEAFWERGIIITSAYAANAVPVAEFTLSQILFSLKQGWHFVLRTKQDGRFPKPLSIAGAYQTTVGLVSLGMIGRKVARLLQSFDVNVIAYDPFVTALDMSGLNVESCSLPELFQRADVVSLHTPCLKETEGIITGRLLASMKPGATFINTSRGKVVCEPEMIAVLRQRPDLFAVLDVTWPEPPEPGSPLYALPNVVLTPHIAGSMDAECRRMGRFMVDEFKRYLKNEPLQWAITRDKADLLA
ncbi:MAG: hydroxyacid dehydrogenase [Fibrobacterota bacterium]